MKSLAAVPQLDWVQNRSGEAHTVLKRNSTVEVSKENDFGVAI